MADVTFPHPEPQISWSSLRLLPAVMWIPLFAVLLTTLAVAALGEWSAQRAQATGARVADVLHRLDSLSDLKSLVSDVENGERGYLLTRDPLYLVPFAHAVRELPAAQQRARSQTAGMPDGDARLARMSDVIQKRVASATEVVNLFNAGHTDEALTAVRTHEGMQLMQDFRNEIAGLEALSQAELRRLQQVQAASGLWPGAGLFVVTLVSLGLMFVVTRQFIIEAVRQENRRFAAEQETRELEKLVEARTGELSALSTHLQEYSEKEKSELARNLHDELGGLLTAAKMDLSWLQSRLEGPPIQERLTQLGSVLDEAMDLKRRVVEDLRPSLLDHFGLPTALRAYLESACAKAGLQSEISVADDTESMPKDAAIALFRVVQEGLTNVIRHAQAQRVRLLLTCDGQRYAFTLSDDGRGFDPKDPQFRWSHGLMGMRQRVRALGGRFTIESSVGGGTTLQVEVPKSAAA